jgi:hypothetical protein
MVWTNEVGSKQDTYGWNIVPVCTTGANGAAGEVCELRGSISSGVYFGSSALPSVFTMCSVTRYAGDKKTAVLTGSYFLAHGHFYGHSGVAIYAFSEMTDSDNRIPANDTDWLIFCGQNAAPWRFLANGQPVGTIHTGSTKMSSYELGINYCGQGFPCEYSDFGVMEIAIWDRTLSKDELLSMHDFYSGILAANGTGGISPYFACIYKLLSL